MSAADILILVIILLLVVLAIVKIHKAKKCGADCMGCSSRECCSKNKLSER